MASAFKQEQNPALDPRLGPTSPSSTVTPQHQQSNAHQLQFEHPPQPVPHAAPYGQPSPHSYYPQYSTPQAQTPHTAPSTGSQSNQASPAIGSFQQPSQLHPHPADGEHTADDGHPDGTGEDPKRPRACEACRGLKVRCDQDPQHPDIPCRRCQKANRPCVITAPSRKRQKKADTRVAELERKLDALTAVLVQQQNHPQQQQQQQQQNALPSPAHMSPAQHQYAQMQAQPSPQSNFPRPASTASSMQPPQKRRRTDESMPQSPRQADTAYPKAYPSVSAPPPSEHNSAARPHMTPRMPSRMPEDFINRVHALVSPEIGTRLFDRYVTNLSPHMPAVVFPPDTTAERIRNEKPILYLCILSAASGGVLHPDVSLDLARESIRTIADCVVYNGAKSLELIQAMQVIALWYKPPEKAEQTNFYQIIHMAAVMAIDIGLGKRFNGARAKRACSASNAEFLHGTSSLPQNSDTLEARRAWLGCYYMCASASMVLRRPNLVSWSSYMKECVDILSTSPEAAPSDKLLAEHIKIQHICEEIGVQFLMDDNTATVSITDPKVTYTLNVLENDLKSWKDNIPTEYKNDPSLIFFEHVASLYLHEIALHFNHNVEDFRLPFTEESLKTVNNSSETLTQHQVSALIACRTAAHGILDAMLSFDLETIKNLPMLIFFVRCTYSIVILIKMHVSITTPGSEIAKMMTADELRVEHYLDSLIATFARVNNEQEFSHHPKILRILSVFRDWFVKHKVNVAAQGRGEGPPEQRSERESSSGGMYNTPTPLDLLSQAAAAGNQQQQPPPPPPRQSSQDGVWANAGYSYPLDNGAGQFPQQQQQQGYGGYVDGSSSFTTPGEASYGMDWGSGFQQAMDLNLGGMEGVGIDGLFMGDGMVPFGGNGFGGEF